MNPLDVYNKDLRRCKFLSREQEHELAIKAKAGDKQARDTLIAGLLCYVVRLAVRFCKHHAYPLEDAIQSGNMGLIVAVDNFDPSRGYRLSTYATARIRQRMAYDALADSTIYVPRHIQQPSVSRRTKITPEQRETWMALRIPPAELFDNVMVSEAPEEKDDSQLRLMRRKIKRLPEPLRDILVSRLNGETLGQIATRYGCTKENIRQKEQRAVRELKWLCGKCEAIVNAKPTRS